MTSRFSKPRKGGLWKRLTYLMNICSLVIFMENGDMAF